MNDVNKLEMEFLASIVSVVNIQNTKVIENYTVCLWRILPVCSVLFISFFVYRTGVFSSAIRSLWILSTKWSQGKL